MNKEIRELLAKDELEQAAAMVNYDSPKLQKYLELRDQPKQGQEYQDYHDLADSICQDILNLIK